MSAGAEKSSSLAACTRAMRLVSPRNRLICVINSLLDQADFAREGVVLGVDRVLQGGGHLVEVLHLVLAHVLHSLDAIRLCLSDKAAHVVDACVVGRRHLRVCVAVSRNCLARRRLAVPAPRKIAVHLLSNEGPEILTASRLMPHSFARA